jgi:hypothetical protein
LSLITIGVIVSFTSSRGKTPFSRTAETFTTIYFPVKLNTEEISPFLVSAP